MSLSKYLMAIDGGTGSIRAIIFDLAGRQIAVEQREWTHLEDPRFPGSMDFDVNRNFQLTVECIRGAIDRAGIQADEIHALATTSMREGFVLYDRNNREIWACANVDARAGQEVSALKSISPGIEEQIYRVSGQTFALGALPRLLWVKNNLPDVYEQAAAITMLNDWIVFRLTGELSVEPSNASTTGIFNLEQRNWDLNIVRSCGLRDDLFPRVYESGSVVGKISAQAAESTGLSTACLVIAGGGDAQLGSVGVGAVSPGQAALFGGSFWQLEYNTTHPVTDPACRMRVNCHAVPGMWQYELIAFFPGLVMRWFRNAFCQAERMMEQQSGVDAYYLLDKQAERVPPGSHGMLCTFSDAMNYIAWKHAAPSFINFAIDDRFDRNVFYRAILENAALVALGHKKMIEAFTGDTISQLVFASGASNSKLWSSIVADTMGIPVSVPVIKEATALGTAILAGVGSGIYGSVQEASQSLCKIEKTYEPNLKHHQCYTELFDRWQSVYAKELTLADSGLTQHMWKAPGL